MKKDKHLKLSRKKNQRVRKKKLILFPKKWTARSKTYSSYPYVLTISFLKNNIFFNLHDLQGRTKHRISTGGSEHLMIITITTDFIYDIWKKGIRCFILEWNKKNDNMRNAVRKGILLALWNSPMRIIALNVDLSISFNGGRRKKSRRI